MASSQLAYTAHTDNILLCLPKQMKKKKTKEALHVVVGSELDRNNVREHISPTGLLHRPAAAISLTCSRRWPPRPQVLLFQERRSSHHQAMISSGSATNRVRFCNTTKRLLVRTTVVSSATATKYLRSRNNAFVNPAHALMENERAQNLSKQE
jgi:hypothetical protein